MTRQQSTSKNNEAFYNALFRAMPGNSILLQNDAPVYTILAATVSYLKISKSQHKEIIGKGVFEAFPSNPGDAGDTGATNLKASLEFVLKHKTPQVLPVQRYDLEMEDGGGYEERYWKTCNDPVLNSEGEVDFILHSILDLTGQVKATQMQEKFKRIENAYKMFMQVPAIVSIVKGEELVIELANDGALKLWNKGPDIIGKPLLKAIPELEGQGVIDWMNSVRLTGQPYIANEVAVTTFTNGTKELRYFDLVYLPYYDHENDAPAGIFSLSHDITPAIEARQKAEENELKYRSLFDSMDQGFCIIEMILDANNHGLDYRFLEINPVFEKQTGIKEAVGKTARELVPNLEQHWFDLYARVAVTGVSARFVEGSNAMGRWFDVYAFKIGNKDSRNVALLFTDITARKKAEQVTRQSAANLRNMIMQSPVAMCILTGPTFIVEVANERMLEIWGKTREEMINKGIFEGLVQAREEGLEQLMHHVYTTGERFVANERPLNRLRNGQLQVTYLNFVYEPFRRIDGTIAGVMAVAVDVTEQVNARKEIEKIVSVRTRELAYANEALKASNEGLARSNVNLGQFAYAASHDLKEPIRKIQIFSQRIQDSVSDRLTPVEKGFFERLEVAANRMATLIDDLLSYSQTGIASNDWEEIDLNKLIQIVLEDLDLEIEEKKATITVDKLFTIAGNYRQLQQAFQNVIANALKYSKPGEMPKVHIGCEKIVNGNTDLNLCEEDKMKTFYCVSISDNGIGFHEEHAEEIFNVFMRLHNQSEYKGSGIGLAIVRKAVENHGGQVWAESTVGEGSTFKILFPASE